MNSNVLSSVGLKFTVAFILLVAVGPISIPLDTLPLTLQTLVLSVIAYWFGWPSLVATVCYIGIGLIGLPVFSGFAANKGILQTSSAGFVIGFLALVVTVIQLKSNFHKKLGPVLLFILAHVILLIFAFLYNSVAHLSYPSSQFIMNSLTPSLLLKSILAALLVKYIKLPKLLS